MSVNFDEKDLLFVKNEYKEFLSDYDHDSFSLSCISNTRQMIACHRDGAKYVAREAINSLVKLKPLSMIRVGDGEGNVLGFHISENRNELKWFNSVFQLMDAQSLSMDSALEFSEIFSKAIHDADILGVRSFLPSFCIEDKKNDCYIKTIQIGIDNLNIRGSLGIIRALEFARSSIVNSTFKNSVITSAWVHIGLLEQLDFLLEHSPKVIIITGRSQLKELFADRLKERLVAFLTIPSEAGANNVTARLFHYPKRFHEICSSLETDLRGTLVLVGAGIFGKIYCATAKRHGGVALDLGSGFDILSGQVTRPIHKRLGHVDLEKISWIK